MRNLARRRRFCLKSVVTLLTYRDQPPQAGTTTVQADWRSPAAVSLGEASRPRPSYTTGHTGHVPGGSMKHIPTSLPDSAAPDR
jgi:hypothetical protein